jgi:serine/threonine-protein kinase
VLNPGAVFAGYRIEGLIGEGGMGAVYLARHPRLPRYDALKVLHPRLTTEASYATRFEREADAAAQLSHPSVVAVYDRGMEGDQLWISMQYVRGTDAAAELRMHGPMSLRRAVGVIGAVADALDHAHAHGLVHRDVKPDNILLSPTDTGGERAMLTDFGIASVTGHTALTSTGSFVATMSYAPIEQLEGRGVDARTDVYALGAVLFELLTGVRPFADLGIEAVYAAKIRGDVPDLARMRPDLPGAVAAVVRRAMAGDPHLRYATCGELAEALRLAAAPPAPPPPPPTAPQQQPAADGATRIARPLTAQPSVPVPPPSWQTGPASPVPPPRRRSRTALVVGALLLVLVVAGGVLTLVLLTGGPGTPAGLKATTAEGEVHLRWNGVRGADHYEIRRDGTRLTDTDATRYTDASVDGGVRYRYQVLAVTGSGDRSDAASFAPITAAVGAPRVGRPAVDGLAVTLSWAAVPGAEHYEIAREGTPLDKVTGTTFTDEEAPVGRVRYQVKAVDDDGEGGSSAATAVADVEPWAGVQPVASVLTSLIPGAPGQSLDGPVAAHSCVVGDVSGTKAVEGIDCTFDNGITVFVNRFPDAATLADVVQFYNYGNGQVITTWSCDDQTQGQFTQWTNPNDGTPFELLTFVDEDLALFNVYVTWSADHTVDDLYNTFFLSGITCS